MSSKPCWFAYIAAVFMLAAPGAAEELQGEAWPVKERMEKGVRCLAALSEGASLRDVYLSFLSGGKQFEQQLYKDGVALEKAVTPCLPGEPVLLSEDCVLGRQSVMVKVLDFRLIHHFGEIVPVAANKVIKKSGPNGAERCGYPFPTTRPDYDDFCGRWFPAELELYQLADRRGAPPARHLDRWLDLCKARVRPAHRNAAPRR